MNIVYLLIKKTTCDHGLGYFSDKGSGNCKTTFKHVFFKNKVFHLTINLEAPNLDHT